MEFVKVIDPSSVEAAYRYILGREPESRDVVERIAAGTQSIEALRQALLTSREFFDRTGIKARVQGRFEGLSSSSPRILIISNCQGPEIARHLNAVSGLPTMGREATHYNSAQVHRWWSDCERADVIISVELSAEFEGIRPTQLRQRYPGKLITMNALFFTGLHPDIVTLGSRNRRVLGPMDNHSGLALRGFLSGLSVDECVRSFNADNFERYGYFFMWDESKQELFKREARSDIRVADEFFERIKDEPLLISENHPTVSCYKIICRRICDYLGVPFTDVPEGWMSSFQAYMPVWPIEQEIAEYHKLNYHTPILYGRDLESFDRYSFIARSYVMYEKIGRSILIEALADRRHPIADDFLS